ncbi:MAG: glycine cleavage system protein H [Nitrososphaerales archaeon]|nr:glycine cleavage system protein H [Nitrososphaerales archaeon]
MQSYKGCRVPEDLLYDMGFHVWVRVEGQTAAVGATEPAQAYAGEVIFLKVKDVGTRVDRGAILATVESAKFMGPMRAPLSGTVSEVNREVVATPSLMNKDSYANWVVKLTADKLADEVNLLTPGKDAIEKYKPIIEEWGVECNKADATP